MKHLYTRLLLHGRVLKLFRDEAGVVNTLGGVAGAGLPGARGLAARTIDLDLRVSATPIQSVDHKVLLLQQLVPPKSGLEMGGQWW